MEPVYETNERQPILELLLIFSGLLMIVMAFFVPFETSNDPTTPVWFPWVMSPVMLFFGALTFIVMPRVRIRAYPDYIEVRYGFTDIVKFKLDKTKIINIEAVKYNPLLEFGGWGIKGGHGQYAGYTAFTASITNRALKIQTTEKNYLLGSSDPEEAETMIRNAIGFKTRPTPLP
jgi:hypothetical protein